MTKYHSYDFKKIVTYTFWALYIFLGLFLGLFWFYKDDLPPTEELRNYTMSTASEVYDRNGKMIYLFAVDEQRKLVSLKELPPYLVDALLVTEDKNFYRHFGVDLLGNVRALLIDVSRMDFSQGASTITQQMARNMFLSLDKKISRKIKEVILALRIERNFSKDEILEIYFNKIFWGRQLYGVEAASLRYFDKHARDLSLTEAATLVGMIQSPNAYDPARKKDAALHRRNHVLRSLYKEKIISESQYEESIAEPLISKSNISKSFASSYFIEHIRIYLEKKYGPDKLYEGGLKIYTTLDSDLSVYADSVLNAHLAHFEKVYNYKKKMKDVEPNTHNIRTEYLQGGLVFMDNDTGQVRAMIGGRNFQHSKFNRILQAKRQPGSSIKPINYTFAIEDHGYTPATVIQDAPISLRAGNGELWTPHNYTRNKYYGFARLRTAVQNSYNLWAVKAVVDIGIETVQKAFNRFGLGVKPIDYSVALGSYEVIPMNLVSAYTTFPNEGVRVRPVFITKVEDHSGKVLERSQTYKSRVVTPETAFLMTSILQTVVTSGTATASRRNYSYQSAGKTGTTDSYRDAWFIGFNRKHIMGIWAGFDDNQSIGFNTSGGSICAPIWGQIMTKAMILDNKGKSPSLDDSRYKFTMPDNIEKKRINPVTGFLVESGGIEEYFNKDNIPPTSSDTLSFNFYPTRWGYNDKLDSDL
ncbi:MAG: PBP1A family penicillin-binding protein [Candidatus Cloacimonetes bacterium]|nr:PBP1A family penicillin-binding protein [Candidatus Cloacimonadota bacterium]